MPLTKTQRRDRRKSRPALEQIAAMLTDGIRAGLDTIGLGGSDLQQSIESEVKGDKVTAYMIEYGQWVVSGRRKFARKVPISALIVWIQKKGITAQSSTGKPISTNRLAFAIQNAIYKNGIRPRDFVAPALSEDFLREAEKMILDALEGEVDKVLANAS